MADLSDRGDRAGDDGEDREQLVQDRGQLVLITGLALAVVLVALVLVTNTAIFTDNLATRDAGVDEHEALGYRSSVVAGVGGLINRENAAEYDSRGPLEANVTAGIDRLDAALARTAAPQGAAAQINDSTVVTVDGLLVRQQNASRAFTSAGDAADWRVAVDTNRTRAFAATVERSSLATTDDDTLAGAFTVVVEGNTSGATWEAFVYRNDTTDDIAVAVSPAGVADATEVCSVAAENATVDFTDATLAGDPCAGLDWREGVSDRYDLSVRNGTNAVGTYNLTVRGDSTLVDAGALHDGTTSDDPDSPYSVPAVYAVTVSVTYETATLDYRTDLRIAPGEDDE